LRSHGNIGQFLDDVLGICQNGNFVSKEHLESGASLVSHIFIMAIEQMELSQSQACTLRARAKCVKAHHSLVVCSQEFVKSANEVLF
jgi:hypothetical protein